MSQGFPLENVYAPGDGGLGNPVRFPNDAPIYATPASGAQFARAPQSTGWMIGAAVIAGLVLLHERRRIVGRWV